jgi:hypothetical protein
LEVTFILPFGSRQLSPEVIKEEVDNGFSYIEFFRDNVLVIAVVALVIFGYFLLLIRKRRNQDFLHQHKTPKA